MKIRKKRLASLVLAAAVLPALGLSCSTNGKIWGQRDFFAFYERDPIRQFVSDVRPYRGNRDAHYRLACYYQEQGNHGEALIEFRKALLIDPRDVKSLNGMGISFDHRGEFALAQRAYEMALEIDPNSGPVLNNLGYSYLLSGKPKEAIAVLQKALALNEKEPRYRNNLGLAYALNGELDLALAQFKIAGEESRAHYNIGRFYEKMGLPSLARVHYSAALSLDPTFVHARAALAAIDTLKGIFQPAAQTQEKSIPERELQPEKKEPSKEMASVSHPIENLGPHEAIPNPSGAASPSISKEANSIRDGATPEIQKHGDVKTDPSGPLPSVILSAKKEKKETNSSNFQKEPSRSSRQTQPHIEISNGNGVKGMARTLGRFLGEKGLNVTRFTNADRFDYPDTRIYYQKGYGETARRVAQELPMAKRMETGQKFDRPHIKVKVRIGKDILSHQEKFKEG